MNTYQVLRQLRTLHAKWVREQRGSLANGMGGYLNGVVFGIEQALSIALACHKAARQTEGNWRKKTIKEMK